MMGDGTEEHTRPVPELTDTWTDRCARRRATVSNFSCSPA
jgi:hypothetical protein